MNYDQVKTDHRPEIGDEGVWDPYPFRPADRQPPARGQRVRVTAIREDMHPGVPAVEIEWLDEDRVSGALVTDIRWDSVGSLAKPEDPPKIRRGAL